MFSSLLFRTLWSNWLNFLRSLKKNSVFDRKKQAVTSICYATAPENYVTTTTKLPKKQPRISKLSKGRSRTNWCVRSKYMLQNGPVWPFVRICLILLNGLDLNNPGIELNIRCNLALHCWAFNWETLQQNPLYFYCIITITVTLLCQLQRTVHRANLAASQPKPVQHQSPCPGSLRRAMFTSRIT